jgi:hypothetical protein
MPGHDARPMPAKYVHAYSKGQKNDFRDAEAVAEAIFCGHQRRRDRAASLHMKSRADAGEIACAGAAVFAAAP